LAIAEIREAGVTEELIAEQLSHTIDLMRAELKEILHEQEHQRELFENRIKILEDSKLDHEQRIRALHDGVTTFKVWSGLANGGASIVSVLAIMRTIGLQ
jgi:hypothetical protein